MSIETYGTGERLRVAARLSAELGLKPHITLLPVPTTRDKKYVANTDILLEDTLENARKGSIIAGYGLPEEYRRCAEALGASVLDLFCDEEYQCENAYLTALGTLGYIMTTDRRAVSDLRFGIVGYGRIGSRLVRMLLFLSAQVRIYTSKLLSRLDLGECGIDSVSDGEDALDFSGIDVLINTAPKDMRSSFPGGKIPEGMRVIELASGNNFAGVEGVEKLPALPEKMYPESAGSAYFKALKRFIDSK
jgi:hypothetical protein